MRTRRMHSPVGLMVAVLMVATLLPGLGAQPALAYDGNPAGEVLWAKAQVGNEGWNRPDGVWQPSKDKYGDTWCARFVANAYYSVNAGGNAVDLKNEMASAGQLKKSALTEAPVGALAFFDLSDYGHIGIHVGEGNVVDAGRYDRGTKVWMSYYRDIGKYAGWAYPPPSRWKGRKDPATPPAVTGWKEVDTDGLKGATSVISCMAVFKSELYVGTGNWNPDVTAGCEVWRHNGSSWTQVNIDGFGDINNDDASCMCVFESCLYVGTCNFETGCEVWRYDGRNWRQINNDGFGNPNIWGANVMAVYDSNLVLGVGEQFNEQGCKAFKYDGKTWSHLTSKGLCEEQWYYGEISSIAVYNSKLYIGTSSDMYGGEVYRYDNSYWSQIDVGVLEKSRNEGVYSMAVFGSQLFIGTFKKPTKSQNYGCEIWSYDSTNWSRVNQDGFGSNDNYAATSMVVFDSRLYVGTNEGEIWSYNGTSWDREFNSDYISTLAYYDSWLYAAASSYAGAFHIYSRGIHQVASPTSRTWGHESIGVTSGATEWYLAEGSTGPGFETWILVQNPTSRAATVSLSFMTLSGEKEGPKATLPGNSRKTFNIADSVPGAWEVSTKVTSDQPVIAERAMYGPNRLWGHDSVGASQMSKTWYLAEGCTAGGFETWVLVQNPNESPTDVSITYMTPAGPVAGPRATLAANSRMTVNVADTVPGNWDVSTKVTGKQPVIVERAVYCSNRKGGLESIGVTAPAKTWYLAEGSTAGGFETWVLVENPQSKAASVDVTFMTDKGAVQGPRLELAPNTRRSIRASDIVPNTWSVSTKVTSKQPVVAERAVYWNNRSEGHDSIGVNEPNQVWYLAEGSTGPGFESWVLVQNPNGSPAYVSLMYMTSSGLVNGPSTTIPANSRQTFNVAESVPGQYEVSTKVISNRPVIAERAMYGDGK